MSQVFGGVSVFVSAACPPHLPISLALPTRCQYRSTPLRIHFEEGEKGMVETVQTSMCLQMCFQIDMCLQCSQFFLNFEYTACMGSPVVSKPIKIAIARNRHYCY